MFFILCAAWLDQHFQVHDAERHEAQGEAWHEARKQNEHQAHKNVTPKGRPAALLLILCHRPVSLTHASPNPVWLPPLFSHSSWAGSTSSFLYLPCATSSAATSFSHNIYSRVVVDLLVGKSLLRSKTLINVLPGDKVTVVVHTGKFGRICMAHHCSTFEVSVLASHFAGHTNQFSRWSSLLMNYRRGACWQAWGSWSLFLLQLHMFPSADGTPASWELILSTILFCPSYVLAQASAFLKPNNISERILICGAICKFKRCSCVQQIQNDQCNVCAGDASKVHKWNLPVAKMTFRRYCALVLCRKLG